ncbi:MAG: O-antigen ligase family protein [Deltaproteobacteria bacterium]|nr:O-antigen ligase family protein [Deltaproteobacteria bacterium]
MDKIILLPFIISTISLLNRSGSQTFILVFIPTLTFLPVYFDTEIISGTPEIFFWSSALIPILISWAISNFKGYTYNHMDLIIFLYILVIFFGQWDNSNYKKAQKLMFNNLLAVFFPYLLTRIYCRDRMMLIKMIKIITYSGAIIAIFNLIEFRMFTNYFDRILRNIWPSYVMWDLGMVMSRWGFKRAFGPFSHPIVSGYIYAFITPLAIWCYSQNFFKNLRLGKIVLFLNFSGIITSLSRAPMIGFFIGLIIIYYGWSKSKAAISAILVIVITIALIISAPVAIKYASVTRATAIDTEQRNVAYRKEMWQAYTEVVLEKPFLGWGRFSVPSVRGIKSIDSEYLGIALSSGVLALALYLLFLSGTLKTLFNSIHKKDHDDKWARLSWCIAAGWISAIFSQATVYSGAQSVQYLFIIGGMCQALDFNKNKIEKSNKNSISDRCVLEFARVL